MLPTPSSGAARKKIIFILGALLAVNAAVAHMVTAQIASATRDHQVKDQQVVIEEATPLPDETIGSDEGTEAPSITIYTIQSGDTIDGIAKKFGVSRNTILWANDMTAKSVLKVGKTLVILPINGIQYTVKSGDTISGIAAKFDADAEEILYFNDLDDPKAIRPGVELIIPDAEPIQSASTKAAAAPKKESPKKEVQKEAPTPTVTATPAAPAVTAPTPLPPSAFPEEDTHHHDGEEAHDTEEPAEETPLPASGSYGIFIVPAPGSVLTQGYHAVNAVDFGAKVGSPIVAAAKGTVIVSKTGCATGSPRNNCNGGFGNFIVISHDNGIQTLYAHLSSISVSVGDSVDQGDQIGKMGNTGRSTGSHLHFETHGIKNPFTKDKKFTQY